MKEQRTIKYRRAHYDIDDKFICFTYWGKIDETQKQSQDCFTSPSMVGGTCRYSDDQLTNLTDENSKEIYENDIVTGLDTSNEPFTCRVKYVYGSFRIGKNNEALLFNLAYNLEVTGTIHEDKHLLEA